MTASPRMRNCAAVRSSGTLCQRKAQPFEWALYYTTKACQRYVCVLLFMCVCVRGEQGERVHMCALRLYLQSCSRTSNLVRTASCSCWALFPPAAYIKHAIERLLKRQIFKSSKTGGWKVQDGQTFLNEDIHQDIPVHGKNRQAVDAAFKAGING
jgi:hypothetical protein